MNGRKPTKMEADWIEKVIDLGCIVCLNNGIYTPCEYHHIDGSKKPGAHYKGLGLCFPHHRSGVDSEVVTSRHPHKTRFEARYGNEWDLWQQTKELVYG